MAEVEKSTPAATTAASAPATDIPLMSGANVSENGAAAEFGTSPTQEPSSNSHPHDSEYDTASDLEGGDDYDDEDDIDDESLSDEETESDEDDGSETDDEDAGIEIENVGGNGVVVSPASAAEVEAQKKVDEDRSNPQYIPKRGTFYEHDDRTAEGEVEGEVAATATSPGAAEPSADAGGGCIIVTGGGAAPGSQTPTISQASKTMKKWQPASGVERWSHDRFDASEQAPKSRSELLASYGYDIRNEDAPPRARRRRRYGRGPSKYSRNWEDEQAYLKASNKERKPPRPSDFPALNERNIKVRRSRGLLSREEKENRGERRMANAENEKLHSAGVVGGGGGGGGGAVVVVNTASVKSIDHRERRNRRYGRTNGIAGAAPAPTRQTAMEFKPKTNRVDPRDRVRDREQNTRVERVTQQKLNMPRSNAAAMPQKQLQPTNDPHQEESSLQHQSQNQQSYPVNSQPMPAAQQQQPIQQQPQPLTTNLSQRLQQAQQRNDPSHVGSVQMHALASQNQQQQQQQQQHQLHMGQQQMPPPQLNNSTQQQILEQRATNAPKRYSSIRRSQHETAQAQHIVEQQQQQQQQHQLQQQLQLQQQQQQSQLMLQDPHMLMQIYEQQQLQAQLQTLQLGQSAPPAAVPQPPKQLPPPPNAYPQAQAAPAAYYVTGAEQVPPTAPYVNPSAAGYLPPTPATVVYAQAQPATPSAQAPQGQPATQSAQAGPPSLNYHQNYNTVGGTTYFVSPAQATTRPAVLPQRRPTNAIPILPPSEKHKPRSTTQASSSISGAVGGGATDMKSNITSAPKTADDAENIDHILDNMFVQRPVFQPLQPAATAAVAAALPSPPAGEAKLNAEENAVGQPAVVLAEKSMNSSSNPVAATVQE